MFDSFLVRALLMLLLLACVTAPLGALMVWRKMSYFGDATSHAALFGVALSLAFGVSPLWGSILMAIFVAVVLAAIDDRHQSSDALLGVLAHGGLAAALIVSALNTGGQGNLEGYLFGDILNTRTKDLWQMLILGGAIIAVLVWRWNRLLVSTLNPELASAQSIDPNLETKILVFLLAICVALAIKSVGALLVGAMLIIPGLGARRFVNTPEGMVFCALLITWIASLMGVWSSYQFDLPTSACVVLGSVCIYVLTLLQKPS